MKFKSVRDLDQDVLRWLDRLPGDFEVVAGIPRSGLLVALLISLHRNIPLTDIEGLLRGELFPQGLSKAANWSPTEFLKVPRKVLVIDDSLYAGTQMKAIRERLSALSATHELSYAVAYVSSGNEAAVDHFAEVVPNPRVFEWNVMHSLILEKACVDIDGVLCRDPTDAENDDGTAYEQFLTNVPLRIRPTRKIESLVTSRLEKYRGLTEEWLRKNQVEYQSLVMLDVATAEERRRLGLHGKFKASAYKKSNNVLFIESEPHQAEEIARLTGKPALCFGNMELYQPGSIGSVRAKARSKGRGLIRRIKRLLE